MQVNKIIAMRKRKPNMKLLFLLVFLLFAGKVAGQTYLLESFDGETFPPNGWTQTQLSGTGLWERWTLGTTPNCSPYSGSGMLGFKSFDYSANTSAVLISLSIDLSGRSNLKLQFWMYRDDGITSKLDVVDYYINTNPSLTNAYLLGTINRPITADPVESSTGWYRYEFEIPETFNGAENYILLKATSKYGMNMFVDEVRVYVPEAANNPPINFVTEGVTQTGMTVKWTDNSTNETGFRVYISTDEINYSQYNDDIPTTTKEETGNEYTKELTGLIPGTTYYFRISAFYELESDYLTGSQQTLEAGQIISTGNGNWNSAITWSSGAVPTSTDNVLIEEGDTITLNATGYFNNLTVNGSLAFQAYTLNGNNLDVSEGGNVSISSGVNANLSLSGNVTNSGTLNFFPSDAIYGRITFVGVNNQTFNSIGTTNIGNIAVNKGNSTNNVIEIITNETFSVKNNSAANFLTLTNGTLKISGTASVANNVFPSIGYTISETCGFWLNNPNFEVLGQNAPSQNNGLLRITAGTYNVGNTTDNSMAAGSNSKFIIEGGVLNVAGRFYTANPIEFNLVGGEININMLGNTSNNASFGLVSSSNTINISGGKINLINGSNAPTPLDYNIQGSNISITGGTLNVGVEATLSPYTFRIRGNTPSLVIDNTENAKTALISASTNVYGDITVKSGSTLNTQIHSIQVIGNTNNKGDVVNNGLITNSSATGSNFFSFIGEHGAQTLTGTGSLGDPTTPFAGITFANTAGVSVQSAIVTNRVNLLKGIVTGSNNISLGNGEGSAPIVQRGGSSSSIVGSFEQTPVISSGSSYGVTYSLGLEPFITGFELPAAISGTLQLTTNVDVTIGAPVSVGKLSFASTNVGKVITSQANLLTISGTSPSDLLMAEGNSGYVIGPLARTLPVSLETGTTYLYPIGKSGKNYFELLNLTTLADGNVIISAEVFDEGRGGSAGTFIKEESLGERYWESQFITGDEYFISTNVRVTQSTPLLDEESGLALSADFEGNYNLVSSDFPVANTISSDVITELGFFAIGVKEVAQIYVSSTTTQTNTDIVFQDDEDMLIVGVEIVTIGNDPALEVTNIEFSTNGTTDVDDIVNAKLFYTGTNSNFSTSQQVGSTISSPGSTFSINFSQDLLEGTNYFWLVYDISENATDKNLVDAECISITIGGETKTPDITAPAGNRIIRARLTGTYLVGVGEQYETITEAISDLNLVGVKGSVIFTLTDEEYSVNETFPITVNEIINSSQDNWVLIKPAADVSPIITGNSTSPIFVVNASYFGIDGSNAVEGSSRDLSIINNGTGASSGIILSANSGNNVSYKNIIGVGGFTSAGYGITLDGVENAVIENCQISKVNIGILTKGNSNQIIIIGNDIGSSNAADKVHTTGIEITNTSDFLISNNNLVGISSATIETASGIKVSANSFNGSIKRNTISNIRNTNSAVGYGSNGLWLNSSVTTSNIKVYNNLIFDIASYGKSGWGINDNGYGLVITSGGGYGIYFNTIHLNTNQTSSNSRTAGLNISSAITTANTLDVRNNIIINTQTIGTRYAVYSGALKAVFADINYNNYYATTGVGFILFARTTLTQWQTGTGKDANSHNVPAYFTSATDLSLIPNMNCALDGFGTPIDGIDKDFNGVDRDIAYPDMGALEFTSGLATPEAVDEPICIGEEVPPLTATTVGIAKWYSDTELQTLVYTGNTFETGDTEVGSYTYYVTDNHGTCISEATPVTLQINPLPSITVPDDFAICFGDPVTLTATGDADIYEWDNDVENGVEFIPEDTQTYTVIATITATGCQIVDEVTVTVKPIPEPTISTLDNLIYCPGDEISTAFTIDITGDSYQWLLNGEEIPDAITNEFTATAAGVYSVVVTDNGCPGVSNEITIRVVEEPIISTEDNLTYCEGETINTLFTIDITGESYQWLINGTEIEGANNNTYTAITQGIFSVEMLVEGCILTSNELEITVYPIPDPVISTEDELEYCEEEPVSVLLSINITGDSYQWLLNGNSIDNATDITYTATDGGIYSVEVTENGCTGVSNEITIIVFPLPEPTISTENALTYCDGDAISVEFTVDIADALYQWYDEAGAVAGATDQAYIAEAAGTYFVEVTVNGCTGISNELEIVVYPIPTPTISTGDALTYCDGDAISVEFTVGIANALYQWYDGDGAIANATNQTYIAEAAGTYFVEVTVNGCTGISNELEIVVYPIPTPTISTGDALTYCDGDAISVEFTVDIADALYQWYDGEGAIANATDQTYIAETAGIYFVEVTVNGCTGISNGLEILVYPIPTPTISTGDALTYCDGDAISVEFTVDIADALYQWYDEAGVIAGATDQTYIAETAGTYYVEVTVNGCTGISNELEIVVYPIPTPTISTGDALTYCDGDAISVEFTVDIADALYQWYDGEGAIANATDQTYIAEAGGTYFVEVTVNGCAGISNEIEIVVYPIPEPLLVIPYMPSTFCEGDEILFPFLVDIVDADFYQWYLNNEPIPGANDYSYDATEAGEYHVEVTVNGCTGASNTFTITLIESVLPNITTNDPLTWCANDQIYVTFEVTIDNPEQYEVSYQWLLNGDPIAEATSPIYNALVEGVYSVEAHLAEFMCIWISNELEVVVNPSPVISIATDTVYLKIDEEYQFDAGEGFTSYLWFDESIGQTYLFEADAWGVGTFDIWVEVTNVYGCTTRDSAVVVVLPLGVEIITHWTFNIYPNPSDGKFYFVIDGLQTTRKLQVSVYSSSGQLVFLKDYFTSGSEIRDLINIQGKAKGAYIIKIFDGTKSISRRIILE